MQQLIFVNSASSTFSLGCIVTLEGINNPSPTHPIMWMSVKLEPGKIQIFKWRNSFEFIWAATGQLQTGSIIVPAARKRANAKRGETILLTRRRGREKYRFRSLEKVPEAGLLQIMCDGTIPAQSISVGLNIKILGGIGLPGSGVVVQQAQPNLLYTWKTKPDYFATFGSFIQGSYQPVTQGLIPFSFPNNVNTMSVTLQQNNTLVVNPVPNDVVLGLVNKQVDKTFRISGRVIDKITQQGVAELLVEAWDNDFILDDLVGSAVTDSDGTFQLSFNPSHFQEILLDRQPDIYFKIYAQTELLHSTENSVLWNILEQEREITIQVRTVDLLEEDIDPSRKN